MGTTTKEIGSSSFNDMISSVDRRSEYVENRAGANVRLNNFLTPYTLDDKSSILNAPCGYSNGVYASLRPAEGENLLTYSNDFSNGAWAKSNLSVASSNGAWEVTDNTTSGSHYLYWGGTTPSSSVLTLSVEAKAGSVNYLVMRLGGFTYAFFNLSNGTLGTINSSFIDAKIQETSDGFYRCSATILTPSSGNASVFYPSDNSSSVSYTGTGTVAITIKNAQLEKGYRATPYTDTTASPAINADFTFTRGSAATRVTKDGLVKNVQILSDDLVQNGDFSQIGSEEITNGDFSQIGSELITNGDFATDSDWILENGAVINNGSVNIIGVGSRFRQDVLTVGKLYKLQYEVISTNGELFRFQDGITAFSDINQTIGSHTYYFKATGVRVQFQAVGDVDARIDNVSVKEVGQDWSFSSQSEFTSEGARVYSSDGSYQYIVQNNILTIGKQYKVTFDVVSTNGASLASGTGAFIYDTSTTGSKTFYLKADDAGFMLKRLSGVTDVTVTNISVKEVGQNWTFVGTASISDGKATINSPSGELAEIYQSSVLTIGNKYKLECTLDKTSGDTQFVNGGTFILDNGSNTIEFIATDTRVYFKRGAGSVISSIDNISVIEITDDTDLPRIDYTNGTGSLLLEPQSTNLLTYSEDFSSWSRSGTITQTDNYGISPDGKRNSTRLQLSNNAIVYKGLQAPFDGARSLYVKATSGSGTIQLLSHYTNTDNIFTIDENWQRVELTDVQQISQNFYLVDTRGGSNTTIFDIEVWGAQYELLDYATSYIPTLGSTVTRNADVCNNAGSSDLINSTEGVLYAEISSLIDNNDGSKSISISSGAYSNNIIIQYTTNTNQIVFKTSPSYTTPIYQPFTVSDITESSKIAFKYKLDDCSFWHNGVKLGSVTSFTPFSFGTLTELNFDRGDGNEKFEGKIKSVAVFKEALTDEELAKITSTTQQEAFYEMRDKMLQIDADYYEFGDYTTRLKKLF